MSAYSCGCPAAYMYCARKYKKFLKLIIFVYEPTNFMVKILKSLVPTTLYNEPCPESLKGNIFFGWNGGERKRKRETERKSVESERGRKKKKKEDTIFFFMMCAVFFGTYKPFSFSVQHFQLLIVNYLLYA